MGNCVNKGKGKPNLTLSMEYVKGQDTFSSKYKAKGGNIVTGLKKNKNKEMYCKTYSKTRLITSSEIALFENLDVMREELSIQPTFLKFIDFCDTNDEYKLIVEAFDSIDCEEYLQNKTRMNEEIVVKLIGMVIQTVYSSLKFLHARSLLHNDVRLSNVLVSKRWSPLNPENKSTSYFKLRGYSYSRVRRKQQIFHRLWSFSSNGFSENSSPGKTLSPRKSSSSSPSSITKRSIENHKPFLTIVTVSCDENVDSDEVTAAAAAAARDEEGASGDNAIGMGKKTEEDIYIDPALDPVASASRNFPFAKDNYAFGILIRELCTYDWGRGKVKSVGDAGGWRECFLPLKGVYEQLCTGEVNMRPSSIDSFESIICHCWEGCWIL